MFSSVFQVLYQRSVLSYKYEYFLIVEIWKKLDCNATLSLISFHHIELSYLIISWSFVYIKQLVETMQKASD